MGWKEIYASKVKTPQEAVKVIRSGDTVLIGHAAGMPTALTDAMADHFVEADLKDVHVVQQHEMGRCKYFEPGMEKHFRYSSTFLAKSAREYVAEKKGDFVPCFFQQGSLLYDAG